MKHKTANAPTYLPTRNNAIINDFNFVYVNRSPIMTRTSFFFVFFFFFFLFFVFFVSINHFKCIASS